MEMKWVDDLDGGRDRERRAWYLHECAFYLHDVLVFLVLLPLFLFVFSPLIIVIYFHVCSPPPAPPRPLRSEPSRPGSAESA